MRIEVAHSLPGGILQQLHEEEGLLWIHRTKPKILIVAAWLLIVQIDVKELPRIERLAHAVGEVESGHRVVRDFRIEPDHLRMLERLDEGERVADGRKVDVTARLVRLRLEGEPIAVSLRDRVLAEEVQGVPKPAEGVAWILCRVRLRTLASAPEDIDLGAELIAEVHRAHRLLQRVPPDPRIVAREGAVPEGGIAE